MISSYFLLYIISIYTKNYYQDKLNTICEITARDIPVEENYTKALVSLNNLYNEKVEKKNSYIEVPVFCILIEKGM